MPTALPPELRVGPEDVDNAAGLLGDTGVHKQAKRLLAAHAKAHPQDVMVAIAGKRQPHRTKALDVGELQELLGDDVKLTGATVRGQDGGPYVVAYGYLTPGGRIAKGALDYTRLRRSKAAGDRVQEAVERAALPPGVEGSTGPSERELELEDRLAGLEARDADRERELAEAKAAAAQAATPDESQD